MSGTKVIIPNADFSEFAITIPLQVTVFAGKSITIDGVTYTAEAEYDTIFEFDDASLIASSLTGSQTNDAIKEIIIGEDVTLTANGFLRGYSAMKKVVFNGKIHDRWNYGYLAAFFYNNYALKEIIGIENLNDPANTVFWSRMFFNCSSLENLDLSGFSSPVKLLTIEQMFFGCSALKSIKFGTIDFATLQIATSNDFYGCTALTTITGNFSNIGVGATQNMQLDFSQCPLTAVSAMVFVNGLGDVSGNNDGFTRTINFSPSTINLLRTAGLSLSTITSKGWTTNYTEQ